MQNFFKKLLTMLAPVLGAGAIGVCPLCWIGLPPSLHIKIQSHLFCLFQALFFYFLAGMFTVVKVLAAGRFGVLAPY